MYIIWFYAAKFSLQSTWWVPCDRLYVVMSSIPFVWQRTTVLVRILHSLFLCLLTIQHSWETQNMDVALFNMNIA